MAFWDTAITLLIVAVAAVYCVKRLFLDKECSGCGCSCQGEGNVQSGSDKNEICSGKAGSCGTGCNCLGE